MPLKPCGSSAFQKFITVARSLAPRLPAHAMPDGTGSAGGGGGGGGTGRHGRLGIEPWQEQSFVQYVPQTAESTVHAAAVVLAQPLTVASIARWASIANEVTCASTNLKSGGIRDRVSGTVLST